MASLVLLDFTPDTIAAEWNTGRFSDVFAPASVSVTNQFLDYNGDNQISVADAELAARKITARVGRLLQPFKQAGVNVVTMYTPDLTGAADPGEGETRLALGRASDTDNTYVIYVGDQKPPASPFRFGVASQAAAGQNLETYAYVFAGELADRFSAGEYGWKKAGALKPIDFTNQVAFGIAHELGHMLGLGHLKDAKTGLFPRNYHDVMNAMKYANPAISTFRTDAKHLMEIGDFATQSFDYVANLNAFAEVHDSMSVDSNGNFTQVTLPNSQYPYVPTFLELYGSELGPAYAIPVPNSSVPPSTVGRASDHTINSIAGAITSGFNSLRSDVLGKFSDRFNLPENALPLINGDLGDLLQLGNALSATIPTINASASTTMSQMRTTLTNAGFNVDYALSDAEFVALASESPADFIRVSRTYTLAEIAKSAMLSPAALGGIGELAGVNWTGQLDVAADIAFTISFGVDSGGFYLVPGNGLVGNLTVGGNLNATLGLGSVTGNAAISFSPSVLLRTSDADGRIRLDSLSDQFATSSELIVNGGAGVNLDFKYPIPGSPDFSFGGDWVWDLQPDGNGFVLDAANSGFDTDAFLNSLTDAFGVGLNKLSGQAQEMLAKVDDVPIVGSSLNAAILPLVCDTLSYNNQWGTAESYLAERGIQIVSVVSPQDIVNGTYLQGDLIQLQFQRTLTRDNPMTFNATGQKLKFGNGPTPVTVGVAGQVSVDPMLTFNMQFGLDATRGPYVLEGASMVGQLPVTIPHATPLIGTLDIGNLLAVSAVASGAIDASATFTLSDFDADPSERFYLRELNLAIENRRNGDPNDPQQQSVRTAGDLTLDLQLSVNSPSTSLPEVLRDVITDSFSWQAEVTYQWPGNVGSYELVSYPTFPDFETALRDKFFQKLDQFNPLPKELRNFLAQPLPFFNRTVVDIVSASEGAKLFLNSAHPDYASGDVESMVDHPPDEHGEYVDLNYDFTEISSVIALLKGEPANLFSLDIYQIFASKDFEYEAYPRTTVMSYMGFVNGDIEVNLVAGLEFGVDLFVGLDTNGFYLRSDAAPAVFLSASIAAQPILTGSIASAIDFAELTGEVTLVATGGLDARIPERDVQSHADGKIRGNDLYRNGELNENYAELSLTLDLNWSLQGRVFIEGTSLEKQTGTYADTKRLYEKRVGVSELTSENFSDQSDDMKNRIDSIRLCGVIGATNYAHLCPTEVMIDPEKEKERVAAIVKGAVDKADRDGQIVKANTYDKSDEGHRRASEADNGLRKGVPGAALLRDFEYYLQHPDKQLELLKDVQAKLPTPVPATPDNPLGLPPPPDPRDVFGLTWVSTPTAPDDQATFSTDVQGNTLYVTWFENHGFNLYQQEDDLAATLRVTYEEGKFVIDGIDFVTDVTIAQQISTTVVHDSETAQVIFPNRVTVDAGTITRVVITGSSRSDVILVDGTLPVPVTILGGEGDDYLQGSMHDDFISGGGGNDTLLGMAGNDELAGDGDDDILFGDYGNDTLDGGTGNDTLDEEVGDDYGGLFLVHPSRDAEINFMVGGSGDDLLLGSPGQDHMDGGVGKDFLFGAAGRDTLRGGPDSLQVAYVVEDESDSLDGGHGNDTLFGGIGNDLLIGDRGDDEIHGGADDDIAYGDDVQRKETGADILHGDDGDDALFGGADVDRIYGGRGADHLHGEAGDDTLIGAMLNDEEAVGDGNDALYGGDGNDTLIAGRSGATLRRFRGLGDSLPYDLLRGGDGDDYLAGGSGRDVMDGGRGGDLLEGDSGDDYLSAGGGPDGSDPNSSQDVLRGGEGKDELVGSDGIIIVQGVPVAVGSRLEGGAQDDVLIGGAREADVMMGGPGSDELFGLGGNDQLYGHDDSGQNDDNLRDVLHGGDGADLLHGNGGPDFVDGGRGDDLILGQDGDDTLYGDEGDDTVYGGNGDDTVFAGIGNDLVAGNAGADELRGGDGYDLIFGHSESGIGDDAAEDHLFGDEGSDELHGQAGDDHVFGGEHDDSIFGSLGNDHLRGGSGNDLIIGDEGDDTIEGNEGDDTIVGGEGSDTIAAGAGDDLVESGSGDDFLAGDSGNDLLYGGDGDDVIYGGEHDDWIAGEAGNDQIFGNDGNDYLDGGKGSDLIEGGAGNDVLVAGLGIGNLLRGDGGNDIITGSDEGGEHDPDFTDSVYFGDFIDGGTGADTINALGGADHILGGEGDDSINAGGGSDFVQGGSGDDLIDLGGGTHDVGHGNEGNDVLYGSVFGDDLLIGHSGDDKLFGRGGNDSLYGGDGDDLLDGGTGTDLILGDAGDDELIGGGGVGDQLSGGAGNDVIRGSDDGADIADGGSGKDVIYGYGGNDSLAGGDGDDVIHGGSGDDLIEGGRGSDTLLGEADHDVIYGHTVVGSDDDAAVDFVYGDFGIGSVGTTVLVTSGNPGRDQLFGGGGNDLLFGEGDDDAIHPGAGASDVVDFGSGESAVPNDFVAPTPTPAPTVRSQGLPLSQASTLPTGADEAGRWHGVGGSNGPDGISGRVALAIEPSIAMLGDVRYIAWADDRSGTYQIYVARHDSASGWTELDQSAGYGGISNSGASSRAPSITVDASGRPVVAWTERSGTQSNIHVAVWNPVDGHWQSLAGAGQSVRASQSGRASQPQIVSTSAGIVVFWIDELTGTRDLAVFRFDGVANQWVGLDGSSNGFGVCLTQNVLDYSVDVDGSKIAIGYTKTDGTVSNVHVKEFGGASWTDLSTSPVTGISAAAESASEVAVAYHQGELFAAWTDSLSADSFGSEVYVLRRTGTTWTDAGTGSATERGVSGPIRQSAGRVHDPVLSSNAGRLYLSWIDHRDAIDPGKVFSLQWSGLQFQAAIGGDANGAGIVRGQDNIDTIVSSVDSSGRLWLTWARQHDGVGSIGLVGQGNSATNVFLADSTNTVANILATTDLNPGDRILVVGDQPVGFTVLAADSGVQILGAPGVSIHGPVAVDGATGVLMQNLQLESSLSILDASNFTMRDSSLPVGGVFVNGGNNLSFIRNDFGFPVTLAGGGNGILLSQNRFESGLELTGYVVDVAINDNIVASDGIDVIGVTSGVMRANSVVGTLDLQAEWTGVIEDNRFHGSPVGVRYAAPAQLRDNRIDGNQTGVVVDWNDPVSGFGQVGADATNQIERNGTGVLLNTTGATVSGQQIHNNGVGISGVGRAGGFDPQRPNRLIGNSIGIATTGPIEFNTIIGGSVGISAASTQMITHNVFQKSATSIDVSGTTSTRILNNTFIDTSGTHVHIHNQAMETEIRGNLMSTSGGTNIVVAPDSESGFYSDHNLLHAENGGHLVRYLVTDFDDILDWQRDLHKFGLNSFGTTVVSPTGIEPVYSLGTSPPDRLTPAAANQRRTGPGTDGGSPLTPVATSVAANTIANPVFSGGMTGWTASPTLSRSLSTEAFYEGNQSLRIATSVSGTLSQVVGLNSVGMDLTKVDAGRMDAIASIRVRVEGGGQSKSTLRLELEFRSASDSVLKTVQVDADASNDRWSLVGDRVAIPPLTRSVAYRLVSDGAAPAGTQELIDDASLIFVADAFAADLGAGGGSESDAGQIAGPRLYLRRPDLYLDWERDVPKTIHWDSHDVPTNEPIRIELWQDTSDGPAFLTTITTATANDGQYTWTPVSSGIDFGTHGLRLQLSLANDRIVFDRSFESFSVPEQSSQYFVNDVLSGADQYTTAAGSHRNTGRLADRPKPSIDSVLQAYMLSAGDTLYADNGDYRLFYPVTISNVPGVGDDEGFVMRGAQSGTTTLRHAGPLTVAPLVELIDADFVTISDFRLNDAQYGLFASDGTTSLTAERLEVSGHDVDGIYLGSGHAQRLAQITAADNGRFGIYSQGTVGELVAADVFDNASDGVQIIGNVGLVDHSLFYDNGGNGLNLGQAGAVTITSSAAYRNDEHGLFAYGLVDGAVIGNSNLSSSAGNKFYENAGDGVYVSGLALIAGNVAYGNASGAGIRNTSGGTVRNNVSFGNLVGIDSYGPVTGNRVYDNRDGVRGYYGESIRDNVIYSNDFGILAYNSSGDVINNLIYDVAEVAVWFNQPLATTQIRNNTIVVDGNAAAVRVVNGGGPSITNNVLVVDDGSVFDLDGPSQLTHRSNYNLYHVTGTGNLGVWAGVARNSLTAWQLVSGADGSSLVGNPHFVDVAGADGIVGASGAAHGFDDDFHLQSQFGSLHGQSFGPVIDPVSGLPVLAVGTWMLDAQQSIGIDRGDQSIPVGAEPSDNGGYINLGAYGGTTAASKSPTQFMLVTKPSAAANWPAGQSFPIHWRTSEPGGTVDIQLVPDGGGTPILIADDTTNDGQFTFTVDTSVPPGAYNVSVETAAGLAGMTPFPIHVTGQINAYYVNISGDADLTDNQYTTAAGDPSFSGISPDAPKSSIREILFAYDLEPGDIIFVDTGLYTVEANIVIDAEDSGVRIAGPTEVGKAAILDRGNTNAGSFVFDLVGTDSVTLSNLSIRGADSGIHLGASAGNTNTTIVGNDLFGNQTHGVVVFGGNTDTLIEGNAVHDNVYYGVWIDGDRTTVSGNRVYANQYGVWAGFVGAQTQRRIIDNVVYSNTHQGLYLSVGTEAIDNEVYGHSVGVGIQVDPGAVARGNVVRGNDVGIYTQYSATVDSNRVYDNRIGIRTANGFDTVLVGNRVYSNSDGIRVEGQNYVTISNNLVYANTNSAVFLDGGYRSVDAHPGIIGNTIYQSVGDAVTIEKSSDVRLSNNILWVENGAAISVAADAQVGFASDYNLFHLPGTGILARWDGQGIDGLASWRFELGFDFNGLAGAPMFLDVDGDDGLVGFGRDVLSTTIIDDGDAGFSTTGTWTTYTTGGGNPGGFDDDYRQGDFGDNGTATWTFSGLSAGTSYRLAATWRGDYYADAQYRISSGGREIGVVNKRQYESGDAADDFIADGHGWEWFGHYVALGDTIQVTLIDTGGFRYSYADAMRLDEIAGDRGIDDDFHLRSGSPAIDRGDPLSPYFLEPLPSGDRINLGAYGNTSEATPSNSQTVQVTSPVGLEKWTAGDTETIQFRSSGLTAMRTALALNAGGTAVGGWSENAFQGNSNQASVAQPIDLTAVTSPAPAEIYQSYAYSVSSVDPLRYELPLRSGSYTVRLHFVSTPYTTFDLSLQGQLAESSVDLNAQAGGTERGLVKEFAVTVVGEEGLVIEMASVNGWYAEGLAGIEVLQPNAGGTANPTASIDVSTDGGSSWTEIATGVALNTRGQGRYDWTIPSGFITSGSTALVRARSGGVSGRSASAFMITPAGNQFYVNVAGDTNLTDNQYTTAAGDNAANGRSPATPMASIAALLRAYDLNPGDTVYVDTGTYDLPANIVIDAEDSGVRIVGPTEVGKAAILDRGNTNAGSFVFDLVGTDSVTLSNLSIRGADSGIHLGASAGNTNTTIVGNDLFGNQTHGVVVFGGNTDTLIEGNAVHDNVSYGIWIDGESTTVSGNRVYANQYGVWAGFVGAQLLRTVIGNVVHSNTHQGIYLSAGTEAVENEVYGHSSGVGIQMDPGSVARGNVVHGNDVGIYTQYSATVDSNRVYDNRIGIHTANGYDTVLVGNRVYSNSEGIRIDSQNYVTITNNLVYANTNSAVYLKGGYRSGDAHPRITGNTIYQSVGDAVTIEQSSDVSLSNNILWVENGAAISVAADAQVGFASDYNLVHLGTGSSVSYGIIAGQVQSDLAAWQAATGDAAHSLAADPLFLDVNGIDNRLGYVDGQDYSRDDNWSLGKTSPAIDSGHSWYAGSTDAVGSARRDDIASPDSGSIDYFQSPTTDMPFVSSGTAMNWKAGYPDYSSQYVLPFEFPFFDRSYQTVTITTGGLIQFENTGSIHWDETAANRFSDAAQIAALWDNLRTNETDDDIFIDESTADQVTIRWDATHVDDGRDVDFAVTLYASGEFRFSYGSEVTGNPVAGYADPRFFRTHFALPTSTQPPITNQAIDFELRPGQVDRGALEFRGSSDDSLAPIVTSTFPGAIGQQQPISALIDSIRIQFSEEVNYFDAGSFAAYELREAGANGTFGDGDDVVYQLVPQFNLGDSFVDLQVLFAAVAQSPLVEGLIAQSSPAQSPVGQGLAQVLGGNYLPEGNYRFSIQSDQTGGVRDTAGLLIDGDGDSNPGGSYVREFEVFFLPEFSSLLLSANVNEGGTATLSGEIIDYSAATSPSVQVDWGDGTPPAIYAIAAGETSFQINRIYAQDSVSAVGGQFAVTATLVNDLGRSSAASDAFGIVVHNVIPMVSSLTGPSDVTEGQEFTLTGQFSDPGTADAHVLIIDWGDGGPPQQVALPLGSRQFSMPHTYQNVPSRLAPIDRTIAVMVRDDGSTSAAASHSVRLTPINAPPSIDDAVMVVAEMADDGQVVGQVVNADSDLIVPNEDTQSFAIVGGSGLGRFQIDNSGTITVVNGAALDYESVSSYSLVVEVTDGHGLKDQAVITILLANVPEVEAIQIGDGTAQRSVIRKTIVRFDSLVAFDPGAFEIQKIGGEVFQPVVVTEVVNGKTVATLSFQGQSTIGGSLSDGNYRLRIVHDRVVAGQMRMRADAVDDFFRFFGDTDGDRDVDGQDYGRLGLTFLKSSTNPAFNPAYDFDGDGDVDGQDYANFGLRFLRRLSQ
ncbi:right-handed parallel beta-helix repeat-containing protein [Rhodopirellula sp. JC639]|uniref:right-handed parallel beta-helix repeat-containing protein n=1 Tax=Stieleria mannarensis TaxID=2755585 RepID=UPI00160412C2|nr:right-handed parallel beta-helix repeat-containing protein [Rhodopirellula sp. JC639]